MTDSDLKKALWKGDRAIGQICISTMQSDELLPWESLKRQLPFLRFSLPF